MIKILTRPFICTLCLAQTIFGISLGKAAVIDFELENKTEIDRTLGKYAASRFSIEIGKYFTLTDRERVKRIQDEMGIRIPCKEQFIGRLGIELNTQTIFTGKIDKIHIKKSESGGSEAELNLTIEVIDSVSGKKIDFCSILTKSCTGGAKDQVVKEAISHGCHEIAKRIIMQYQSSATIQNLIGNRAIINIGSREGYKLGQELIVYRGNIFVGMAKIVLLENMHAEIAPINGLMGLSTGDKIRAISVHLSKNFSDNSQNKK